MMIMNTSGRAYPDLSNYPSNAHTWCVLVKPLSGLYRAYVTYLSNDQLDDNELTDDSKQQIINKGRHITDIKEINLYFPQLTIDDIE